MWHEVGAVVAAGAASQDITGQVILGGQSSRSGHRGTWGHSSEWKRAHTLCGVTEGIWSVPWGRRPCGSLESSSVASQDTATQQSVGSHRQRTATCAFRKAKCARSLSVPVSHVSLSFCHCLCLSVFLSLFLPHFPTLPFLFLPPFPISFSLSLFISAFFFHMVSLCSPG